MKLVLRKDGLAYEGVTSDGKTFVSVDAEEVQDALNNEDDIEETLNPDLWAEDAYNNPFVTLTDIEFLLLP